METEKKKERIQCNEYKKREREREREKERERTWNTVVRDRTNQSWGNGKRVGKRREKRESTNLTQKRSHGNGM